MTIIDPISGVPTPPDPLTMSFLCMKCRALIPVGVSMDDAGQILDDPLDFADFYAHHWTHEVPSA